MPNPLRKRFQIHLSTAVVMMFVAGGLMWANFLPQRYFMDCTLVATSSNSVPAYMRAPSTCYGWPLAFHFVVEGNNIPAGYSPYNIGEFAPLRKQNNGDYLYDADFFEIPLNLLVWASILTATPMICEWLIGRGAARKSS